MTHIVLAVLALALMLASPAAGQRRGTDYDRPGGFLSLAGFNTFEQFSNSGSVSAVAWTSG